MNEAALLIYFATFIAAVSLSRKSFKNRFSPIALPLAMFACVWAMFSIQNIVTFLGLDMSQWMTQLLKDFDFLLVSVVAPLWVWVLIEYQEEKKSKILDIRILLFLIHPFILFSLVIYDVFSNGFLSQDSPSALIQPVDRIGGYAPARIFYGWVIFIIMTTISPYLIIKKQKSTFWPALQVFLLSAAPFVVYALYHTGVIHIRLVGPVFVIYLYWLNSQFRLLDIMPVAMQSIIDKVGSGILVVNRKSKLVYINNYANDLLGLQQSSEVLNRHETDIPEIFTNHFDILNTEKQQAQLVTNAQARNENICYLDASLEPVFDPLTQKHLGATLSFHDVTERKQTELKLQGLDRQKAEFFAGISHEFRTPLTLSLGHLKDLASEAENIQPDALRSGLSQVENNNKRLLKLVNQLLQLSQLDASSLEINPVLLDLKTNLPVMIANFESLAEKQNSQIHLQWDHLTDNKFEVYFDSDAFDKIISNLLSNALKSMPKGGDVYIRVEVVDAQHLELSVSDTGCGIPSSALPKVFKMFYSHQNDNAAWPQGTGVGLSLVKRLLALHSAKIDVSSVEAEGTTFTLDLLRGFAHFPQEIAVQHSKVDLLQSDHLEIEALEHTVSSAPLSSPTIKSTGNKLKETTEKLILLVEDNAEMRAYIRKHLSLEYRLIEAADGKEGLALALKLMPDLVLSDVMMPKMSGYDLCKQLKTSPLTRHIPVILLTAKSSHSEKLEGLELGADEYLNKPFDVQELLLRIQNLIQARSRVKQFYKNNGLNEVIENQELPKRETLFLDKLQKYVHENISKSDIRVTDLASIVNMSERTLSRKLKALTGDTPKKMLLLIRLEYAAKLLHRSDDSITQISYSAGFADTSHFTRCFKSKFLVTPTNFRKNHGLN